MASDDLSGKNKYYTLYEGIREDILRGAWRAGEKLPAKRTLAAELGVSVVTVQNRHTTNCSPRDISARKSAAATMFVRSI